MSVVDGFNLPMRISPSSASCSIADCPVDLNPNCEFLPALVRITVYWALIPHADERTFQARHRSSAHSMLPAPPSVARAPAKPGSETLVRPA